MADSRRGHGQQRRGKRFCRRIKYLRGASDVTAGDEYCAVFKQGSGVPRARGAHRRREHSKSRARVCGVKNLGGT